jgi:hypothetical protein
VISSPHDQGHDAISIATSFAYKQFHVSPRFTRIHAVQIEPPIDAVRTASQAPQLARIDIETPSFDTFAIIDDLEPSTRGDEHLQSFASVRIEVLRRRRLAWFGFFSR